MFIYIFLIIKKLILASIDWMMPEASGVASEYITTTIRFLEDTFRAFTHLPVRFVFKEIIAKDFFTNKKNKKILLFFLFFVEKSKFVEIINSHIQIPINNKS